MSQTSTPASPTIHSPNDAHETRRRNVRSSVFRVTRVELNGKVAEAYQLDLSDEDRGDVLKAKDRLSEAQLLMHVGDNGMDTRQAAADGGRIRKRKAEGDDISNERLSKRLGLLNLERNDNRLHVAVEASRRSLTPRNVSSSAAATPSNLKGERIINEDVMQLDNTAHKVYIYNIDDELSSSDESGDEGKILFPAHIKKHLLETRIPDAIRVNADGDIAGVNVSNELMLYNVPSSLTVPEDRDNVRKAIIESRARAREAQRREREAARIAPADLSKVMGSNSRPSRPSSSLVGLPWPLTPTPSSLGEVFEDDDPDAMEID